METGSAVSEIKLEKGFANEILVLEFPALKKDFWILVSVME